MIHLVCVKYCARHFLADSDEYWLCYLGRVRAGSFYHMIFQEHKYIKQPKNGEGTWTLSVYCEGLKEIEIPSNVGKQETFIEKVKKGCVWIFWWNSIETGYEFYFTAAIIYSFIIQWLN